MSLTPEQVENRLKDLSKQVDEAQDNLSVCELEYYQTKTDYEVSLAKSRLVLLSQGVKTVGEREDRALVANEDKAQRLAIAEAKVRAARGNSQRVREQVDIARSIGTSVRAAMDL
jgi:predicted  nucleic acid-binding Zn-ribbon protein